MAVFRKMLLIGLGMLAMSAVYAERGSFVKSIPQAIPSKNLFQVNIDRIDGGRGDSNARVERLPIESDVQRILFH